MTATFSVSQPIIVWAIEQAKRSCLPSKSLPLLEAWLAGEKTPTYDELLEVSQDTHIPFGFFFLKNPPKEWRRTMTLEEVKKIIREAMNKSANDSGDFAEGLVSAYDGVLNLLADVEDVVRWHPYPQEKPKENGSYIGTMNRYGNKYVHECDWDDSEWIIPLTMEVTAWTEMPKPYEEIQK